MLQALQFRFCSCLSHAAVSLSLGSPLLPLFLPLFFLLLREVRFLLRVSLLIFTNQPMYPVESALPLRRGRNWYVATLVCGLSLLEPLLALFTERRHGALQRLGVLLFENLQLLVLQHAFDIFTLRCAIESVQLHPSLRWRLGVEARQRSFRGLRRHQEEPPAHGYRRHDSKEKGRHHFRHPSDANRRAVPIANAATAWDSLGKYLSSTS